MPIDTHLDANPADITASAAAVEKIKASVDKSEDDLIGARKNLAELEGATAVSSVGSINSSVKSCLIHTRSRLRSIAKGWKSVPKG